MLKQRVITALVLLAILLPALFYRAPEPFFLITLFFIAAGGWEWVRMNGGGALPAWLAGLGCALLCTVFWRAGLLQQPLPLLWLFIGGAWVLLGAFFWAVHMMVLAWLAPRMNGVKLACAQFWVCAGLSLAVAGYREPITISGLKGALMPILYGGLLSVGVAYTLQVVAQRHAPPIHAAIILSLESVFAALAGWVILGEVLSLRGITGCLLMLAGMLIVQLWPRPALEQATAADAR